MLTIPEQSPPEVRIASREGLVPDEEGRGVEEPETAGEGGRVDAGRPFSLYRCACPKGEGGNVPLEAVVEAIVVVGEREGPSITSLYSTSVGEQISGS